MEAALLSPWYPLDSNVSWGLNRQKWRCPIFLHCYALCEDSEKYDKILVNQMLIGWLEEKGRIILPLSPWNKYNEDFRHLWWNVRRDVLGQEDFQRSYILNHIGGCQIQNAWGYVDPCRYENITPFLFLYPLSCISYFHTSCRIAHLGSPAAYALSWLCRTTYVWHLLSYSSFLVLYSLLKIQT